MSAKITDHMWAPAGGWDAQDSDCLWCKQPKAQHARHLPVATAREKLMPIMFWGSAFVPGTGHGDAMAKLVEVFATMVTGRAALQPKDCVRTNIPRPRRELAAGLLASGKVIESYMGWADCRICRAKLGTKDLGGWGHLWPEKAEHYVLEHDVWVPGLDRLIERSGN